MEISHIVQASTILLEMSFEINAYITKTEFWKNKR